MIPTLLGITLLTFGVIQLVPGDPAEVLVAGSGYDTVPDSAVSEEALERFRREYLLDQPLWRQYLHYVGPFDLSERGHAWFGGTGETPWGGLVLGDLGREIARPHVEIRDEILRRLRVTIPLALVSLLLAYLLALPLGIAGVLRKGGAFDFLSGVFVFLLYAVPAFWAALLFKLVFGAPGLDLLQGGNVLSRFVLPVATLTYGGFAYLSRQMRSGLFEVIREDYVRTARAKGLPERVVVLKHALRNALGPVLTIFGTMLPGLIGGSIIVESVFDLPGMGSYAYDGLSSRDYFIVMGTTTFSAVVTLGCILLSDIALAWVDPRVRYE